MLRLFTLVLAAILLLLPASTAMAQDGTPTVFCGDLEDDDCALLQGAAETMAGLTSGTTTVEFTIEVNGLPELPISDADIAFNAESSFVIDPELYTAMDPAVLMDSGPDLATEMSIAVLNSMDMAQSMQVDMSANLAEQLSMELQQTVPDKLALNLRLVDGILYVDLASLADVIPELGFFSGWLGMDLIAFMEMAQEAAMAEQLDQEAVQGAMMLPGLAMGGGSMQLLGAEEQVDLLEEFVQVRRLRDAVVKDVPVAVFSMTVDFADLVSSPEFLQMMTSQLQDSGAMAEMDMTAAELEELGMVLSFIAPMLFQSLDFEVTQAIGLDVPYVYESDLVFDWNLSEFVALAEAMSGESLGLSDGDDMSIYMGGGRMNRDFDDISSIPVPVGATVLPVDMLMQLIANL